MFDKRIRFPIIELTDWVFDGEEVFLADFDWDGIHYIKEEDFERQHRRLIVDSNGEILKVTGKQIIRKKGVLFSFIIPPTLVVKFNLEMSGKKMTIKELKNIIISRSSENFIITYHKLMTEKEYINKIKNAQNYRELIKIAAFIEENE